MSLSSRLALVFTLGLAGLPLATTSVGCAKKGDTEAAVNYELTLGSAELVRRPTGAEEEQDALRYQLRFTNSLQGPATIDKVDFSYGIADRELGNDSASPGLQVAVGDTGKISLIGRFEWRQSSEMPGDKAFLKGTVYWTGPNGNARTSPFDFSMAYTEIEE